MDPHSLSIETVDQFGLFSGVSITLTPTLTTNLRWGYTNHDKSQIIQSGITDASIRLMAVHGNVLWQPVSALKPGWELIWGERQRTVSTGENELETQTNYNVRTQFGAWCDF